MLWGFFVATTTDRKMMSRALGLAEKGRGNTLPNPMVGAVIVKNGKVVGQGYHKGPGTAHAEVAAIKSAGARAKRATMYVTLEPCCHNGRTGPCTEEIKKAGISRLVYATGDLNPLVNGKGAGALRRAGLKVENGLLKKEATRLNEVYFSCLKNKRPFVTLKLAQSIDGRIATINGDSKWITGTAARKFAHQLRSDNESVLVGMGTVIADNPALTTRHLKGNNPYRIVLSDSLKFPCVCRLLDNNKDFKTIVATTVESAARLSKSKKSNEITFWEIKRSGKGKLSIADLLQKAYAFGISSMLIEGGAQIATSFLKAKLVDKIVLITAPILLGSGTDAIGDLHIKSINRAVTFSDSYRFVCGNDQVFVGYPDWSN